jgi:two-component system, chemotaxis family, protein-glutamate methylesterase/glutaminase
MGLMARKGGAAHARSMKLAKWSQGHDIVVIGGSAGGVEAMQRIVAAFPADLKAAVFIVVHTSPGFDSALPQILSRKTPLKVTHAIHGEPIEMSHIYVAPPDNHIVVRPGYLAVQRGPKENGARPAVDPLFRSASISYGPRVIAVVVSGNLDCGTAGLVSVKARGGLAIVQTPDEAVARDMPQSAIDHVPVDHILPIAEIGPAIVRLTSLPVPKTPERRPPTALLEVEGDEPGVRSDVVCPICQGALTEGQLSGVTTFRCHVGHAFSPAALVAEQAESLERALWAAVRALEESARMAQRIARSEAGLGIRLEEKARTQMNHADLVRRMLLGQGVLNTNDGEDVAEAGASVSAMGK